MNIRRILQITFCLLALYVMFGFVWWFVVSPYRAKNAKQRFLDADHVAIVTACRNIMREIHGTNIMVINGFSSEYVLPQSIVNLKPLYIVAQTNQVYVRLYGAPRVAITIFNSNVMEYGVQQITNGLWLSQ